MNFVFAHKNENAMTLPLTNHYLLNDVWRETDNHLAGTEMSSTLPYNRYFLAWCVSNRDLSQLEFFRRLLEEAMDESVPPLERLKFLSILSSNIDELFMVRVSALKEMLDEEEIGLMPGELMPAEQLKNIRQRLLEMLDEQGRALREAVLPELSARGISVLSYEELSGTEKRQLDHYFIKNILRLLTPLAVDAAHPFPYVPSLALNIGLMVEPLAEHGITRSLTGEHEPRFACVKVPSMLPRLLPIGSGNDNAAAADNSHHARRFIPLEEAIKANIQALFPRMRARDAHTFRVTRDADIEIKKDKADDLLRHVKKSLRERKFGIPVRLEVSHTMSPEMIRYLTDALNLEAEDVYTIDAPLNIPDLMSLYDLTNNAEAAELKDKPLRESVPAILAKKKSFFDAIKKQDILLHHPYASYSAVTDFIRAAAHDPDVVAIKMCLYRTGHNSPILQSLIEASENGKQVTAVVEIKARFDEERNIEGADRLAAAGVQVVYGVMGLKTHCKVALVVRRENHELQTYVHVATGNYNPTTSRVYTDFGLLTADAEIGDDATDLFNFLTGFSRQKDYRRLLVAPVNLRDEMLDLIAGETLHARHGRPAHIIAKINRLTDLEIIEALYKASQAGVKIDLIVRGACMLRPCVAGLSETIHVRSIVGRFLEHSRIFYFANGGAAKVFIGSADWMTRNLDRRIEVVAPVSDARAKRYLKDVVLDAYLRDNVKARVLSSDGVYEKIQLAPDEQRFDSQLHLEGNINF